MKNIYLSVVIPAYNEAENIKNGVLDPLFDYLSQQKYRYEVIFVDDASKDNTVALLEKEIKNRPEYQIIKNKHGGKAITVMTGLLASVGEIAVFTDFDQSTPIKEVEKLIPKFNEGADIVIGKRHGRPGAPLIRKIYSLGSVIMTTAILRLPFRDTQCGFKAFKHSVIEQVFPILLSRWRQKTTKDAAVNPSFDVEFLFLARKKGYKIKDVYVEWHHVGSERVNISAAIEAVTGIFKIRCNSLLGKYK